MSSSLFLALVFIGELCVLLLRCFGLASPCRPLRLLSCRVRCVRVPETKGPAISLNFLLLVRFCYISSYNYLGFPLMGETFIGGAVYVIFGHFWLPVRVSRLRPRELRGRLPGPSTTLCYRAWLGALPKLCGEVRWMIRLARGPLLPAWLTVSRPGPPGGAGGGRGRCGARAACAVDTLTTPLRDENRTNHVT